MRGISHSGDAQLRNEGNNVDKNLTCGNCNRDLGSKAVPLYRHSIFSYNRVGGVNNYSRLPGMTKHIIGFRCPYCFHETYTKKLGLLDKIDPQTLNRNIAYTIFTAVFVSICLYLILNSGGY